MKEELEVLARCTEGRKADEPRADKQQRPGLGYFGRIGLHKDVERRCAHTGKCHRGHILDASSLLNADIASGCGA